LEVVGDELDRPLISRHGVFHFILLLEDHPHQVVSHGQTGLDLEGLLHALVGQVETVLKDIQPGKVIVRELAGGVGHVEEGLLELGFGLGQLVHLLVDRAQVVVGLRELGMDLQALLVRLSGLREVALQGLGQADGVPSQVIAGVEGQGLNETFEGFVDVLRIEVALVEVDKPEVVLVLWVLGPGLLQFLLGSRAECQGRG